MAFIEWKEDFSVKVRDFDNQHKKLIELTNELFDAMRERRGNEVLKGVLDKLIQYTLYHFNAEEKVMEALGYPDLEAHREKHRKLAEDVMKYKDRFDSGNMAMSVEILHFLKDWLRVHIQGADRNYSAFLNENGVS